jgi:hypothetical protein
MRTGTTKTAIIAPRGPLTAQGDPQRLCLPVDPSFLWLLTGINGSLIHRGVIPPLNPDARQAIPGLNE